LEERGNRMQTTIAHSRQSGANLLLQTMVEQGLITNPRFIRALQLQAELLGRGGTPRLLVDILAELEAAEQRLGSARAA
jgi:hypothetical protein